VKITLRFEATKLSSRRVTVAHDPGCGVLDEHQTVPRAAGASYAEIAAEVGCDWRTVRKYLAADAESAPPKASSRRGTQPRRIDRLAGVVEAWLRTDIELRGSVIHERLVQEYEFAGSYWRVKLFLREARPRIAAELTTADDSPLRGLHRRFEVVAGARAQVDWGEEGVLLLGGVRVYSFHLVLSYSRDPYCCTRRIERLVQQAAVERGTRYAMPPEAPG
jgi:transposase